MALTANFKRGNFGGPHFCCSSGTENSFNCADELFVRSLYSRGLETCEETVIKVRGKPFEGEMWLGMGKITSESCYGIFTEGNR